LGSSSSERTHPRCFPGRPNRPPAHGHYPAMQAQCSGLFTDQQRFWRAPLGSLGLEGAPADRGLLDMIAALQWVQVNIVTLPGRPRKGHNRRPVGWRSRVRDPAGCPGRPGGLFGRVIVMSGNAHLTVLADRAHALTERAAAELGCLPPGTALLLCRSKKSSSLQKSSTRPAVRRVQGNAIAFARRMAGGIPLAPSVDGDLLSAPAIDAIRAGAGDDIALIAGNTADEHRMLASTASGRHRGRGAARCAGRTWPLTSPGGVAAYAASEASPAEIVAQAFGDFLFRVSALRPAKPRG